MSASMIFNYFGVTGRGEATRVALAYAGKDFKDVKMKYAEYQASKWAGKGLPVLEMDNEAYTQSTALLRYAGKLGGLYPEDPLAALKVDEIVMIGEDFLESLFVCLGQKDDTVAKAAIPGKVYAIIANVEAAYINFVPSTLIADMAAPLLVVKDAVLEDPKVKAYYASKA